MNVTKLHLKIERINVQCTLCQELLRRGLKTSSIYTQEI